jgi:Polyketide synthase modules and related proteins
MYQKLMEFPNCTDRNTFTDIVLYVVDFEALRIKVHSRSIKWPDVPFRRASVNSFGYGGSNVHVILDEAKTALESSQFYFKSSYSTAEGSVDLFEDKKEERPHLVVFSSKRRGFSSRILHVSTETSP